MQNQAFVFLVVNIVNKINIKLKYYNITIKILATELEKKNGGPYNKMDQNKMIFVYFIIYNF